MIHKLFSVFDEKAQGYLPPFVLHNEAMAVRVFADCVNDPNHQFGKHPEDYFLFELGTFDDVLGTVKPHETIRNLGIGKVFVVSGREYLPGVEEPAGPVIIKNGQAQGVSHE